jgi:hypothetical protein
MPDITALRLAAHALPLQMPVPKVKINLQGEGGNSKCKYGQEPEQILTYALSFQFCL